jgi:hypothetical protein
MNKHEIGRIFSDKAIHRNGRCRRLAQPAPAEPRLLRALRVVASGMAKSPCPLSKTQFLEKAESVKLTIGTSEIIADKREFSTGSFGWYHNGKTTITVDGKPLAVQVGINLTVVGSKDAER